MSIIIPSTQCYASGNCSFAMGYHTCANGICSRTVPLDSTLEATYISLVKRVGLDWKIEMHESRDEQRHLNYIESLRGNPNVEEAKVLKFTKIAGITNSNVVQTKSGGGEPDLIKITR